MRGAVRLTAGLIMLLLMLEPVMLLLNGGFDELLTALDNDTTWSRLPDSLPVQTDAEQAVRQGEAVWQAGWQPLVAAATSWLDEQLAWEIRDRFGETARVETELAADGTLAWMKVTLTGPARGDSHEVDIQRWLATRLGVAESRVTVVRDSLLEQQTLWEQETLPTETGRAEAGGSWDD